MTTALAPLRWWHLDDVAALEQQVFAPEPWSAELFWSELAQGPLRHYLGAFAGDRLVGYAGLAAYADEAYVQTLAVAAGHRGQGLGRRLLAALLEEAWRRGAAAVGLECRVDNAPALALYADVGFGQVGLRRGYYQPSNTDAAVLALRRPPAGALPRPAAAGSNRRSARS